MVEGTRRGYNDRGSRISPLLVYPPCRFSALPRHPPFGLMSLAAVLREHGIQSEILDLNALRPPLAEVKTRIAESGANVFCIGGMATVYYYIKCLTLYLKERYPKTPIVCGGSLATSLPEHTLRNTGSDVCVLGEGEPVILDVLRAVVSGEGLDRIPGIAYLDPSGRVVFTPPRPRLTDLDSLPYPAYDMVDMDLYFRNELRVKFPTFGSRGKELVEKGVDPDWLARPVTIFTKRGCPYQCTFCYRNFGRQLVSFSVDYVISHMRFLEERFRTKHFVIADETFNANRHWVREFCRELARRNANYLINTANSNRAANLDEELVWLMHQAGFSEIGVGIESFHDPSLRYMKKGQTAQQTKDAIAITKRYDSYRFAMMLFGFPTDSKEAMDLNVKTLSSLGIFSCNFNIPCPYPGTELFDYAVEKGIIDDVEEFLLRLADKDVGELIVNVSNMSDKELLALIRYGYDALLLEKLRNSRLGPLHPILKHVHGFIWNLFRVSLLQCSRAAYSRLRRLGRADSPSRTSFKRACELRKEVFSELSRLSGGSKPSRGAAGHRDPFGRDGAE
ncbi:MAG: hypothetical protein A2V70_14630 [Planctomycetes bacterium RBG_13_63_9]|nr:MAG: hypothetical protein A2V70_14630 [Planctomycetes bacterium RBG_13_63_9]